MIDTNKISVIIPTYNCKEYLKLCLNSLIKNAQYKKHEVIVCVDGSTDGTWEFLNEFTSTYPFLQVIGFKENIGECTALNRAVEHASGEYILMVNDDMVFPPDWDIRLVKQYQQIGCDVLSCRLIEPGIIEVNKMFLRYNFGVDYKTFDEAKFNKAAGDLAQISHQKDSQNQPMLMRKTDFMKVGGWDERFNTGPLSDPDFYIRLLLCGTKFCMTNWVLFYHFSGKATRFKGDVNQPTKEYFDNEFDNVNIFHEKWGFLPIGDPFRNFSILPPQTMKGITFPWAKKGLYELILKKKREQEGS
jgi:glycosyltransferase involved in cell wall biosynthesis